MRAAERYAIQEGSDAREAAEFAEWWAAREPAYRASRFGLSSAPSWRELLARFRAAATGEH